MHIEVNNKGVFIDGHKVERVCRVDVINLNPIEDMEVVIHIPASEIEVDYQKLAVRV